MGSAGGLKWALLPALAFFAGCGSTRQVRVLTPYAADEFPGHVRVDAVNATGRELPLPPAGLLEQAVRVVTQQPEAQSSITDAFQRAAEEPLRNMGVETAPSGDAVAPRPLVTLRGWDVRDGEAAGGIIFVSVDYQLLGTGGRVLWEARAERQPVRLSGPNLSRYEVWRVARTCAELGLASLQARARNLP